MFTNILVPTDGSSLSRRAIKRAVQLAREQGARVTAFWVGPTWQPNVSTDSASPVYVPPQRHVAQVGKTAERHLAVVKRCAAAAGVRYQGAHVVSSFPYYEIVKAARRYRCDLIIMASHGRRGISRLLLGSETGKVLAHRTIPVMVCH